MKKESVIIISLLLGLILIVFVYGTFSNEYIEDTCGDAICKVETEDCVTCPFDCGVCHLSKEECKVVQENQQEPEDWCVPNTYWAYGSNDFLGGPFKEGEYGCLSEKINSANQYYQIVGPVIPHESGGYTPAELYNGDDFESKTILCWTYIIGVCTKSSEIDFIYEPDYELETPFSGLVRGSTARRISGEGSFCMPFTYMFDDVGNEYFSMGSNKIEKSDLDFSEESANTPMGTNIISFT